MAQYRGHLFIDQLQLADDDARSTMAVVMMAVICIADISIAGACVAPVHRSSINATISTTGTPINQRRIGIEKLHCFIAVSATCGDTIGSVATAFSGRGSTKPSAGQ